MPTPNPDNASGHRKIRIVSNAGVFVYAFGYYPLAMASFMAYVVFRNMSDGQHVEKFGSFVATVTVLSVIGLTVSLTRYVVSIDRNSGELITWWGLLLRFKRARYAVEDFDTLALATETISGHTTTDKDRFHAVTYYSVYLSGPDNSIKLKRFSSQAKAVALARKINQVLGLKVSTNLGLFNLVYPVQQAGDRNSGAYKMKEWAVASNLVIRRQGGAIQAFFPLLIEKRWLTRNLVVLALALVVIVSMLGIDYLQTSGGHYFIYFIAFFATMFVGFLLISHRKRPLIMITTEGIELFEISLLGFKKRLGEIARDEIQQLSEYRDKQFGVQALYQSIQQTTGLTTADLDKLYDSLAVLNIRN